MSGMELASHPQLARIIARAAADPEILAVILFGSRARGEAGPGSDFDVCLVLASTPPSDLEAGRKRLEYLSLADVDIRVFQQLPLHIRSRVLKEGRALFARDEDALYAPAARTARRWEAFRHIQRLYLDEVARG